MHDVLTRPKRRQGTATRQATADKPAGARPSRGAPAAFPAEVRVPPHRGALIVAAPVDPPPVPEGATPARTKRKAPAMSGQPARARAADKPRSPARAKASSPTKSVKPRARKAKTAKPAVPLPVAEEMLVLPATAAATAADSAPATAGAAGLAIAPAGPAPAALPRGRALVRPGAGLVARVVAWLDRLMPRRRRAALPRVRTRLERPPAMPRQDPAAPQSPAPLSSPTPTPESAGDLARRMLLQLSEENERLRREIERLRATVGEPLA